MNIFDKLTKEYDNWYEENKKVFLEEVKGFKKILPKKGIGIEIGVGTGRFAEKLKIKIGVDISENMLKLAVKRGIIGIKADAMKMPFIDECFDFAVLIMTICFLKRPIKALKEVNRILRKKGIIAIGFIDKNSPIGILYRKKKSVFYKNAKFYSIYEIKKMMKNCGFGKFKIIRVKIKLKKIKIKDTKGSFIIISGKKLLNI